MRVAPSESRDSLAIEGGKTKGCANRNPGKTRALVVLLPSCPQLFAPQVATVPSEQSARLCEPPAAMATADLPFKREMPKAVLTAPGTARPVTPAEFQVPSPSWP